MYGWYARAWWDSGSMAGMLGLGGILGLWLSMLGLGGILGV